MKEPIFTGAAVAIITPMKEDGSVNYEEFGRFIDWQIETEQTPLLFAEQPVKVQHWKWKNIPNVLNGVWTMLPEDAW